MLTPRTRACLILLVVLLATAVSPSSAAAAGGTTVRVTPDSGLLDFSGDGQFVSVSWHGFTPGVDVFMRECVRGATDYRSQCSAGGYYSSCGLSCPGVFELGPSDGDGGGTAVGRVAVGVINADQTLMPIDGRTFTCDYVNECSLFLFRDGMGFDLTTAIEVPVGFATPIDACPTDGVQLSGSGGSAALRQFVGWAPTLCTPPTNILLNYLLTPARTAVEDYVAGRSSFAVTPQPLDDAERAALSAAGGTAGYAPVTASAMVFAYRAFDQRTRRQIDDLVLTPDQLAQIFTAKLSSWGDRSIRKLNPGHVFPTYIAPIARGDANEDTFTMTRWMWANARQAWIAGGVGTGIKPNPFAVGPTDILPSVDQRVTLVTGMGQEARVLATGGDFNSTSTYGTIGYVDSSWAAQYDLPTVKIRFDDGRTVAATPSTIDRAIAQMQPDDQCLLQPDVTIQDPKVWPMPTISYAVVPRGADSSDAPPTPETAAAISALIKYAAGRAQQDVPAGYAPLPAALRQDATQMANQIMKAPKLPPDPCKAEAPNPPADPGTKGGGGTPPPPSPGPPASPSPSPSPSPASPTPAITTTVFVRPSPPSASLVASGARLVLPMLLFMALLAAIAAPFLLYGDRFTARLAPVAGKAKASAARLTPSKRRKQGRP